MIAAAFKSKGKKKMKRSELIYTMSFDLNWFTHEGSKKVVEEAEKEGLLAGDDELQPTFDLDEVELTDFKPDLSELLSRSVTDRIIEEIAVKLKKDGREVVSMVNRKQEELGGIISFPVAALIVAKEVGINIAPYIEEVEREVFQ
ncbi:predicted coding region AF_1194 [Archaeoglobus fulgidus DSM 4304]|uniref:DUF2240 family protein n=1 Tax=Archaeoglobus fulgidus (strain ATCC 49558 / DSM 4304 / JCM 9628 / NBRC 100126 / VC-16) TaxID=224325 RepID=O29073_ARCFU|nr:predicted coding region AF_1194 [Archaeoglobus fulgidus DSM 4304]